MRLHILSDLHLEFEPFTPAAVEADAVILADVSTGHNGLKWALKSFPDRPVIYVLGNHEFYGQKVQKLTKELQEMAKGTNVHLLALPSHPERSDFEFCGSFMAKLGGLQYMKEWQETSVPN
jgi:hypothetical protein